jgi:nicotinamide-nucleotide amidase
MTSDVTRELAKDVLEAAKIGGLKIATAESCTGGLVAAALTAIAGSSEVFERGFVTYSNEAKSDLLGVDPDLIAEHGAVSAPVALAMALGALDNSRADIAVSITGIAGPGGGSAEKPVGLVIFGIASALRAGDEDLDIDFGPASVLEARYGELGRDAVREESVRQALRLLLTQTLLRGENPAPPPAGA